MCHARLAAAAALTLGAFFAGAPCAWAAQSASAASSASDVRMAATRVSAYGTVTAVDAAKRKVTIKNAQGVERTYTVDPEVKNVENLNVGDRVRLDYLVAVAVALRKGGDGIREKVESEAEAHAPAGGKPGYAAGTRTTIVSNVLAVDRARQTVRLQGPEGRVADFKVNDKTALSDVKVGDQVVAVVYEAVAVGVRPAGKPGAAPAASAAR